MRRLFADAAWLKASERAIAFAIWGVVVLLFHRRAAGDRDELDAIELPIGKNAHLAAVARQGHLSS